MAWQAAVALRDRVDRGRLARARARAQGRRTPPYDQPLRVPWLSTRFDTAVNQHVKLCCTRSRVKTNITLKVDADLLRDARVIAAEEGRSVSALVADRLEALVRERKAFDRARRRALARLRGGLDLGWTPPLSRDELHER